MKNKYDYLVIGSGPAGYASAVKASRLGLKTAIVERYPHLPGGVCLNEGCIPAKSLYNSAKIYDAVRNNAGLCGLGTFRGRANMSAFVEKSRAAVSQLHKGLLFLFKKNGIDFIGGTARFVNDRTVRVCGPEGKSVEIKAEKILIATGSIPKSLPFAPFDSERVISSSDAIRLSKVPEEMLIVGGGSIGVEFASFFNTIGTKVSVVEAKDSILPEFDREISGYLEAALKKKGININTSGSIEEKNIAEENGPVLVCIGRNPATSELGLEEAGIETDSGGFIPVNAAMRTSVRNIYAAGDVVNTPMLAHLASAEGETAAADVAGGIPEPIDYTSVPHAVYGSIQAASVGMSEEKLKEKGAHFTVGKSFFKANGRAVSCGETEGLIKVLADKKTGKLLGVHIVGHEASELINEFVVAKRAGLSAEDVGKAVHAHPTFAELARDACRAIPRRERG